LGAAARFAVLTMPMKQFMKGKEKREVVDFYDVNEIQGPFTVHQVREAFKVFDADSNGFVSGNDLRKVYNGVGIDLKDEEIGELLQMMDLDGDGQIDLDEFGKLIWRTSGPPITMDPPETSRLKPGEIKAIVGESTETLRALAADTSINKSSNDRQNYKARSRLLRQCLQRMGINAPDITRFRENLGKLEGGGDAFDYKTLVKITQCKRNEDSEELFRFFQTNGLVHKREFLLGITNTLVKSTDEKIKIAFELYDEDGNGVIDIKELTSLLKVMFLAENEGMVHSKAQAIMRQADSDGNGEISKREFRDLTKRFPNLLFPPIY